MKCNLKPLQPGIQNGDWYRIRMPQNDHKRVDHWTMPLGQKGISCSSVCLCTLQNENLSYANLLLLHGDKGVRDDY